MEKINFKRTNLQWIVDYDYERSACTCEAYERGDYCRCTTIEHAWIDNVNVNEVVKKLYEAHSRTNSDIDEYCFDRICSTFKIYDKDYYEIEKCWGYYGQEIEEVYVFDDTYDHLVGQLCDIA